MFLLLVYLLIAIGFSFLCSIAEAVLLSVTPAYVSLLQKQKKPAARWLAEMKDDINRPLAAILSLNTIAHTVGAAGTGAEAARIFGDAWMGVISGVLTLLILVFSEIIPKSLGARYWRRLAPLTGLGLRWLVVVFYPLVQFSALLTRGLAHGPGLRGFSREEFAAMAELSEAEGQLEKRELSMMQSLLVAHKKQVRQILTPRPVVFHVPSTMAVGAFLQQHGGETFSRIPLSGDGPEHLTGFVLRSDLLLAGARGEQDKPVADFLRPLPAIHETMSVTAAFRRSLGERAGIMQVIDEHGGFSGILTMEDLVETVLGLEITDEGDKAVDMQKLARRRWRLHLRGLKRGGGQSEEDDA